MSDILEFGFKRHIEVASEIRSIENVLNNNLTLAIPSSNGGGFQLSCVYECGWPVGPFSREVQRFHPNPMPGSDFEPPLHLLPSPSYPA